MIDIAGRITMPINRTTDQPAEKMDEDLASCCAYGASVTDNMVPIRDGVSLRIVHITPATPAGLPAIVLLTGLSTVIESFAGILRELSRDFEVFFVESREKPSSKLRRDATFDLKTFGEDVAAIVSTLKLQRGAYALLGYSLGATAVIEGYHKIDQEPRCLVLMEPTPVFHYPAWSLPVVRWLALPMSPVLRYAANRYLQTRVIDVAEDPEMARLSALSINRAEPWKLRGAVLGIAGYAVWDRLDEVDCPTLVVVSSKDRLHVHEEINRMVATIEGCRYVDLETNERSHSAEMAIVVREFVQGLSFTPRPTRPAFRPP